MRIFRVARSTRSFYSLFLTVLLIFSTIVFIQLAAHLNFPVQRTTKSNAEVDFHTSFVTIASLSDKSRGSYVGLVNETRTLHVSFINRSRLVTQHVLRTQYMVQTNKKDILETNIKRDDILETTIKLRNGTVLSRPNGTVPMFNSNDTLLQNFSALRNSDKLFIIQEELSPDLQGSDRNIIEKVNSNVTNILGAKLQGFDNFTWWKENNSSDDNLLKISKVRVGAIVNESVTIERNYTKLREKYSGRNESLQSKLSAQKERIAKRPNYCPLWPSELDGPLNVDMLMNLTELPEANQILIKDGGRFTPSDCRPRERTAVIIPYRDRAKHLAVLLRHLHTILQRQKIEYAIYVVEMAFPTQFNRGLLANVGFLTASSIATYTCYVIHDVDLLMTDDRNMYRCGRVPRHLTAANSKYKTKLPYLAYFGGVEAFTPEQFWKVNGFSNLYFGWGGEDDDMVYRIFGTDQHISRPRQQIGGYVAIEHTMDSANPPNPNRVRLVKTAIERMPVDGVKTVAYTRLALEFKPLYTWVYIAVKEAKIMEKFQQYLEET